MAEPISTSEKIIDALADNDYDEVIKLATAQRNRLANEKVQKTYADAKKVELIITGYDGFEVRHRLEASNPARRIWVGHGVNEDVDANWGRINSVHRRFNYTAEEVAR